LQWLLGLRRASEQVGSVEVVLLSALTFEERQHHAFCTSLSDSNTVALGQLQTLRNYWGPSDGIKDEWNNFLAQRKLSEADLLDLARPIELKGSPFRWATILRGIMRELEGQHSSPRYRNRLAETLAFPLVQYATRRCFRPRYSSPEFAMFACIQEAFKDCLLKRLANTIRQVAAWELQIFRVTPNENGVNLVGYPLKETIQLFLSSGVEKETLRLLRCYPALARLCAIQIINWTRFAKRFLKHYALFFEQPAPRLRGSVALVECDLSDLHNGNQSVVRLCTSRGREWFYKPRSGEIESAWFALLQWLNEEGFEAPFKILTVEVRRAHCWMEGICPSSCSSMADAALYYFRAGAILFLAHVLRAVDFHAGNIIAHGSQPVIVDCETLFHPIGHSSNRLRPEENSVLRTGMLPVPLSCEERAEDCSALGCRRLGPHSVRLRGRVLHVSQFVEDLINGFLRMYTFLCEDEVRQLRFVAKLRQLRPLRCRHIHRPTSQYAAIRNYSVSHRALKNGLERSISLNAACRHSSIAISYRSKEVYALQDGDIPIFHGKSASPVFPNSVESVGASVATMRKACAPIGA
jgi:lantibiotic modifying enzyme